MKKLILIVINCKIKMSLLIAYIIFLPKIDLRWTNTHLIVSDDVE